MQSTALTSASLVPTLADLFNKRVRHAITDLQPGDSLHATAPLLGFPRGRKIDVYGYCTQYDAQGQAYAVVAYVRPFQMGQHTVTYSEREAGRYPATNQQEQWFGSVLMYLTEIDLTEYADCLRLERLSQHLVPLLPAALTTYRQAA
jgi:hypothetical protein